MEKLFHQVCGPLHPFIPHPTLCTRNNCLGRLRVKVSIFVEHSSYICEDSFSVHSVWMSIDSLKIKKRKFESKGEREEWESNFVQSHTTR